MSSESETKITKGRITVRQPGSVSRALSRLANRLPEGYAKRVVEDAATLAPKERPPKRTIRIDRGR